MRPTVLRLAFVNPVLPIPFGPIPPSRAAKEIIDGARMNGVQILLMAGSRECKSPSPGLARLIVEVLTMARVGSPC